MEHSPTSRTLRRRGPVLALVACGLLIGGCGSDEEGSERADTSTTTAPTTTSEPETTTSTKEDEVDASELARRRDERAARNTVRSYVSAINRRNGEALCKLFVRRPDREIDPPRVRGSCAATISASIGYRDPRGVPVFERAAFVDAPGIKIDGDDARVTATVVTNFADRKEPSVEDDVIYLQRAGRGWKLAKASSTLYRAIGAIAIPPEVISPPR